MHVHPNTGAKTEIAQVFRRFAAAYREKHCLGAEAARVLRDLERCRTAALGGHLYRCQDCGRDVPLYNSCLNRHCPTCQGPAQYRWIEQRQRRLLNTPYFHLVFTLPAILRTVVFAHRRILLDLLFGSAAKTLHAFAADPERLGAQLGFTLVLHTWTRQLLFHPHLHAIVTGGGLSFDAGKWIGVADDQFLFPVTALSRVFRGKFLDGFIELWKAGKIDLTEDESRNLVRETKKHNWVVYAKRPFGGPMQIVNYLGRYTHRVGISSSRLVSISEDKIVFRTRGEKTCSLAPEEFIRRFLLHVLPRQFFKIRHYGLLAPGNVNTRLVRAQELLGPPTEQSARGAACAPATGDDTAERRGVTHCAEKDDGADAGSGRSATDRTAPKCPHCGGKLLPIIKRGLRLEQIPPPDT
ncbi:MAG: IS91 family transposase [Anaerolineales bacterium]